MIQSITVKNIALIDQLSIEFASGLNVLSGETGAGKSIIVDSMNLLLGERADRDLIRNGQEKAHVEAEINVNAKAFADFFEKNDLEAENELIISRDISVSGKNICRINGIVVSLSTLKTLMDRIVDLHGQHEHQSLLYAKNHLTFIDSYGGERLQQLMLHASALYDELKSAQKQMEQLGGDEKERIRNMDILAFQVQEIQEANIKEGEEEALRAERDKLSHAQTILQALSSGYAELYEGGENGGSAISMIQDVVRMLSQIAAYDKEYETLMEKVQESAYVLEECAHDLRDLTESVFFDEQRQAEIEERIEFLNVLKRKYGNSEAEILSFCATAQKQLDQLQNAEEEAGRLAKIIQNLKDKLYDAYIELSEERKETAHRLEIQIRKELADLGMPDAEFEARFEPLPSKEDVSWKKNGIDEVEFYLSTNAGEPQKPLAKIASGGEISRVMLAFKNIAAGLDEISTLIFDEIDTGISGKMALTVSEKMAAIAKERQVICVTHLPQIAAMADANFLIQKFSDEAGTHTTVSRLAENEVQDEIARLAGGIETESSRKYASDLRMNAQKMKKALSR